MVGDGGRLVAAPTNQTRIPRRGGYHPPATDILCSIAVLATALAVTAFADVKTYTSGNATYAFDESTRTLTVTATGDGDTEITLNAIGQVCSAGEVEHLQLVTDGGTIYISDEKVFGHNDCIQSITVRGNAAFLNNTFDDCTNLTSVYIFGDANFEDYTFAQHSNDLKIYGYTGTEAQADTSPHPETFPSSPSTALAGRAETKPMSHGGSPPTAR